MPETATGIGWPFTVVWASLYWANPSPTSVSALILNAWPDTVRLAANAPLARPKTRPAAATVGTPTATAKRRQLVRPYAGSPCASFTDPPRGMGTAALGCACDRHHTYMGSLYYG